MKQGSNSGRLVTLRDIANATGLSLATVSMALSDTGSLKPATRERVKSVAAGLGYVRNPLLSALALRRRFRAGAQRKVPILFLGVRTDTYESNPLKPDAVARAAELGYDLREEQVNGKTVKWESWARIQYARGVHGLLISPVLGEIDFSGMPWERFAVVGAGRSLEPMGFPTASGDVFAAVLECHRRLKCAGCRRIGYAPLRHEPEHPDDVERHAACLLARSMQPAAADIPILRCGLGAGEPLAEECKRWFLRYRPDGVVGFHPGILCFLRDCGADVPGDVRFASLNIQAGKDHHRGVAGIADVIGRSQVTAVELLDSRIRHSRFGLESQPPRVIVEPIWIPGNTCPE